VIQKMDLQEARGVGHPAGELPVGIARRWVARGVVVAKDERVGTPRAGKGRWRVNEAHVRVKGR
jgi:hypothetical protein